MGKSLRKLFLAPVILLAFFVFSCSSGGGEADGFLTETSGPGLASLSSAVEGANCYPNQDSANRIVINEVMIDPSTGADDDYEWIELYNPTPAPMNISNWTIEDSGANTHTISGMIASGGYFLLCVEGNPWWDCDDYWTDASGLTLGNSGDSLTLEDDVAVEVDAVTWTSAVSGKAKELHNPYLLNSDMMGADWSYSTFNFDGIDLGTPGTVNDQWDDYEHPTCDDSIEACINQFCVNGLCDNQYSGASGCCEPDGSCMAAAGPAEDGDPCTIPTCQDDDGLPNWGTCSEIQFDPNCCDNDSDCPADDPATCQDHYCQFGGMSGQCSTTIMPYPCCTEDTVCIDGESPQDPCTEDTCNLGTSTCQHVGALYPGGNCCFWGLDCVPAGGPDPCIVYTCQANDCVETSIGADCCAMPGDAGYTGTECDDLDPCTDDWCLSHVCKNLFNINNCCATAFDCDDENECTTDECTDGVCSNTANLDCTEEIPYIQSFDDMISGTAIEKYEDIGWEFLDYSSGSGVEWDGDDNWRWNDATGGLAPSGLQDLGSNDEWGTPDPTDEFILFYTFSLDTTHKSVAVTPTIDASSSATSLYNPSGTSTVQWRMAYNHFADFVPFKVSVRASDSGNWDTAAILWEMDLENDLEYDLYSADLGPLAASSNLRIGFWVEGDTNDMMGLTIDDVYVAEGVANRLTRALIFDCAGQDENCGVYNKTGLVVETGGPCATDTDCPYGSTCETGACGGVPDMSLFYSDHYKYVLCFADDDSTPALYPFWGRPHSYLDDAFPLDTPSFITPADLTGIGDACNAQQVAADFMCGAGNANYFCILDVDPQFIGAGIHRIGVLTQDEWHANVGLETHSQFKSLSKATVTVLDPGSNPLGNYMLWAPTTVLGPQGYLNPSAEMIEAALVNAGRSVQLVTDITLISDLTQFDGIFVSLGVTNNNHVMSWQEGQLLRDYLDNKNGARLYIEGAHHSFLQKDGGVQPQTELHEALLTEGVGGGALSFPSTTVLGTNFLNGWTDEYSTLSIFDQELDALKHVAGTGAREILHYDDGNSPPEDFASAVAYDTGDGSYRTVASGLLFGGFADGDPINGFTVTGDMDTLMVAILDFLENGATLDNACTGDLDCELFEQCTNIGCGTINPLECDNSAITPCDCIVRVDPAGADGAGCGTDWAGSACATIQGGIDEAVLQMSDWGSYPRCEVWVKGGTYDLSGVGALWTEPNVELYGGFDGTETARNQRDWLTNETILDGSNSTRVIDARDPHGVVIDGLTIINGTDGGSGGGIYLGANGFVNGAGVFSDHLGATIENCTFYGNTSPYGGAIRIHGNYSGAAYLVKNCAFADNQAWNQGGAIYVSADLNDDDDGSRLTIINSTFTNNSANIGGAIYLAGDASAHNIFNSVIYGNTASTSPQIGYDVTAAPVVSYSNVEAGFTGTGNINAAPLFYSTTPGDADFLYLELNSPCIDAGYYGVVDTHVGTVTVTNSVSDTDTDGNGRVDHTGVADTGVGATTYVDMGAFENQFGACPAGEYLDVGTFKCEPCLAGTFKGVSGHQACTDCPAGQWSDTGATACTNCDGGYNTLNLLGAPGATMAEACDICPAGTYSVAGDATCTDCPAGEFSAEGTADNCGACPTHYYSETGTGADTCEPCPAGTDTGGAGIAACIACPVGQWSDAGIACADCPAGTNTLNLTGTAGVDSCVECPAGSWSVAGDATCTNCLAGYAHYQWNYTDPILGGKTTGECVECQAGSWAESGDGQCTACAAGSSTEEEGAALANPYTSSFACVECTTGHWAAQGDPYCRFCAPGYSSLAGSLSLLNCFPCSAGTYADPTGVGLDHVDECTDCPDGTFSPEGSDNVADCGTCPGGYYAEGGAGSCTACPAGTSTSTSGDDQNIVTGATLLAQCIPCAAGWWSLSGDAGCTACVAGTTTNGSTGSISSAACIPCVAGYYSDTGDGTCTACNAGYSTVGVTGVSGTDNSVCTACLAGSWSAQGDGTCTNCDAGWSHAQWNAAAPSDANGPSTCVQCQAGSWAASGDGQCTACTAGTSTDGLDGSIWALACVACAAGTHSAQGDGSCTNCDLGYSTNGATGTITGNCSLCPDGSWAEPGDGSCTDCPAGEAHVQVGGFTPSGTPHGDFSCTMCNAGSWSASGDGICTACLAGTDTVGGAGATSCTPCAAGYHSAANQGTCDPCDAGDHTDGLTGTVTGSCLECPAGSWSAQGDGSCTNCDAGQSHAQWNAGAPSGGQGPSTCVTCNAGSWALSGNAQCTACAGGESTNGVSGVVNSSFCFPCAAGTHSAQGDGSCTNCDLGYSTNGATGTITGNCSLCPDGSWAEPGDGSCTDCPAGEAHVQVGGFTPSGTPHGSFSCTMCNAGSWSASGDGICTACIAGTDTEGFSSATSCTPCAAGYHSAANQGTCDPCDAGDHTDGLTGTITGSCLECPAGSWSAQGDGNCSNCVAGWSHAQWNAGAPSGGQGPSTCVTCDAGSWALSGDAQCTACAAGESTNGSAGSIAAFNCIACAAGTHSAQGDGSCTNCDLGYSTNGATGTITGNCSLCPDGSWANSGDGFCTDCPAGEAHVQVGGFTPSGTPHGNFSCMICNAGSWSASGDGICTACLAGTDTEGSTSATSCTPCAAGYHSAANQGTCDPCDAGDHTDGLTGTVTGSCLECPAGSWSAQGDGNCSNCVAGWSHAQWNEAAPSGGQGPSTCVMCDTGSFAASGDAQCTACNAGEISIAGSFHQDHCTDCPAGTWSASGDLSCTACLEGESTNGAAGSTSCTVCTDGTWSDSTGNATCTDCAAGTFDNNVGGSNSLNCQSCDPGYWSPAAQTACTACIAGTNTLGLSGSDSIGDCVDCIAGWWSAEGDGDCTACAAGTSTNGATGSILTECVDCVAGTRSSSGDGSCTNCLAGTFSFTGSENCSTCPGGTWSHEADPSCTNCAIGYYSGSGATDCTECPSNQYQDLPGQSSCKPCTDVDSDCIACSDTPECTACDELFGTKRYLHEGDCVAYCPTWSTPDVIGYYGDTVYTPWSCKACETNCDECTDNFNCTGCFESYYLDGGNCYACTLSNCNECSDLFNCTECDPGYCLDDDNQCVANGVCSTYLDDTQYCNSGTWEDSDDLQSNCNSCGLSWDASPVATFCCGDDEAEVTAGTTNSVVCADEGGACTTPGENCCDDATDCVADDGTCYDAGACVAYGGGAQGTSLCDSSGSQVWLDGDNLLATCTACGFDWPTEFPECCGDDAADAWEALGAPVNGYSCCWNADELVSGNTDALNSSILCCDGELWDCDNQIGDPLPTDAVDTDVKCALTCNTGGAWL